MTLKKMLPAVACLLFLFQRCTAHALQCNISRDGHQMIYRVSAASDRITCVRYSWTNFSDNVIATNLGHLAPVTNSNLDSLTSSECLINVSLEKHCMLENGELIDLTAICTTNCSEEASPHQEDGSPAIWIGVAAAVVVFICLVVLGLFSKKCKCKDKLLWTCSCHFYTLVMKPNSIPNPHDVEAGNPIQSVA